MGRIETAKSYFSRAVSRLRPRSPIKSVNRYFRLLAPLFEFLGITALVILALVYPDRVQVDWPIVALIVLLLLVPFLPFISRVRYGEIEAELDTPSREEEMADLGESPQIKGEGEPLDREEST